MYKDTKKFPKFILQSHHDSTLGFNAVVKSCSNEALSQDKFNTLSAPCHKSLRFIIEYNRITITKKEFALKREVLQPNEVSFFFVPFATA